VAQISILSTVLPQVFAFICFFDNNISVVLMCNLGLLEITEWEPWLWTALS